MARPQQLGCLSNDGKDSNHERSRSLSDLPDEVLVVLMQHVPLQQRMVRCALLSLKFRRAAAAGTVSIKHHAASMGTVYALQAYLQSHGARVDNLDLKPPLTALQRLPFALQRLPCPGLLKLQLTDTLVQLTAIPGSQQPGILSSCTSLTSLCLLNCNVLDPSQQLGGLSVLQDLQELVVKWDGNCSRRASQPLSLLPGTLLSQLVRLRSVYLSSTMRFASLEHLSCLTALQQFHVVLAADTEHESFPGAHQLQHLTSLYLSCYQSEEGIGISKTSDLSQLTSLQELDVWACKDFRPTVLKHMSNLQDLTIRKTCLPGDARGTSELLQVLASLTAVTQLDFSGTLQHPAAQLEDYTAMACLSNLGVLELSDCVLPAGMWRQLAETGMPMRSVWSFTMNHCTAEPLNTDGLSSLVKCFPSLAGLSCVQSTQPNIQWTPLQRLPCLQAVHISGVRDADVHVLTFLQHLTTLKIMAPSIASSRERPDKPCSQKVLKALGETHFNQLWDASTGMKKRLAKDKLSTSGMLSLGLAVFKNLGLSSYEKLQKWLRGNDPRDDYTWGELLDKMCLRDHTQDGGDVIVCNKADDMRDVTDELDTKMRQPDHYPLRLVSTELTTQTMVVLPRDAYMFYEDPPAGPAIARGSDPFTVKSPNPSDFVLASSTIPIYFTPFGHVLPQTILQGAAQESWRNKLLFGGPPPKSVVFADGAILSNLPIHLFRSSPQPQLAKIGVMVTMGRERDAPLKIDCLQTFIEALSSTTRLLNDRSYLQDNPIYDDCIVNIMAADFRHLDFDMSKQQKEKLLIRGMEAGSRFLEKWRESKGCWQTFKARHDKLEEARRVGAPPDAPAAPMAAEDAAAAAGF